MEGLTILMKYCDPVGYNMYASHEQLWAGPNPTDISKEDADALECLGWFIDQKTYSCYV